MNKALLTWSWTELNIRMIGSGGKSSIRWWAVYSCDEAGSLQTYSVYSITMLTRLYQSFFNFLHTSSIGSALWWASLSVKTGLKINIVTSPSTMVTNICNECSTKNLKNKASLYIVCITNTINLQKSYRKKKPLYHYNYNFYASQTQPMFSKFKGGEGGHFKNKQSFFVFHRL